MKPEPQQNPDILKHQLFCTAHAIGSLAKPGTFERWV